VVDKLQQEFKDKGLVVLTVNTSEDVETIREFLKGRGYTFPVLLDENNEAATRYFVTGVPQSYVIDQQRNITLHLSGYGSYSEAQIRAALTKVLFGKEEVASAPAGNAAEDTALTRLSRVSPSFLLENAKKQVQPPYPPRAKQAGIKGEVSVEIIVSETGEVIAAKAVNGPEELREVCVLAARMWSFYPMEFTNATTRLQGVLTFTMPQQ
jgi:TonB family protein